MALLRTANWGRDAYDIAQPPSPATLRLSMVHESGRYQRLVLPTDATDWVWQAELDSDAPSRLTISAPPPDGRHLYIKQVWDGVRRELRADASIHAPAGTRRFRLRLTRERLGPDIADAPTRTTALLANYPNPFNPETWIPFTLAEMSSVAIAIYDTRGLPVRQISLGDLPAGRYSEPGRAAHWDGRNEFGETVASGVYIYELRAAGRRELRRMVLLQ
jgi:hypothetical protein